MDNEGLLAWSEYEVERAREVLERAKAHRGELREIVRFEKEAKRAKAHTEEQREIVRHEKEELAEMAKCIAYIEKLGVPRKVWMAALSMDALSVLVEEAKELLRRCGIGEEELRS